MQPPTPHGQAGCTGSGAIPHDPAELIKLPGVGRYTAGAVATFAYEQPVAAVDTNVARVIRRAFVGGTGKRVWAIAAVLVPKNGKRAWRFNQAIMELGALVCIARKPKCPDCPVKGDCRTGRRLASKDRRG